MQPRPVIGLTGGIGSGKSTVAEMLAALGALVIDADTVGHDVYRPGTDGFRQVVAAFGPEIAGADGSIDRRVLGARVFADRAALRRLNAIVHPLIAAAIRDRLAQAQAAPARSPVVVEAAIMLEAGWRFFDEIWVVVVQPATAIARVTAARGLSADDVARRIAAQLSNDERRRAATRVIENDGSREELRAQVEAAWRALVRA